MQSNQFANQKEIQHIIEGLDSLYNQMLINGKIDVNDIKAFMEPYFARSGYRTGGGV